MVRCLEKLRRSMDVKSNILSYLKGPLRQKMISQPPKFRVQIPSILTTHLTFLLLQFTNRLSKKYLTFLNQTDRRKCNVLVFLYNFEFWKIIQSFIRRKRILRPVRDSVRGRTCTKKVVLVLVCFRSTSWYDLVPVRPRTSTTSL